MRKNSKRLKQNAGLLHKRSAVKFAKRQAWRHLLFLFEKKGKPSPGKKFDRKQILSEEYLPGERGPY